MELFEMPLYDWLKIEIKMSEAIVITPVLGKYTDPIHTQTFSSLEWKGPKPKIVAFMWLIQVISLTCLKSTKTQIFLTIL